MTLQVAIIRITRTPREHHHHQHLDGIVAGEESAHRTLGPSLAGSFRRLVGSNWVIVQVKPASPPRSK